MENKTRFDLDHEITKWRGLLTARESVSADKARELESHLRDAIAAWLAKGLSTEEAFLLATRRLGAPARLVAEFEKEDATALWRSRLLWMILGVLCIYFLEDLSKALIMSTSVIAAKFFLSSDYSPVDPTLQGNAALLQASFDYARTNSPLFWMPSLLSQFGIILFPPMFLYFVSRWLMKCRPALTRFLPRIVSSRFSLGVLIFLPLAAVNLFARLSNMAWIGLFTGHFRLIELLVSVDRILYALIFAMFAAAFCPRNTFTRARD